MKRVVLLIQDGWGIAPPGPGNYIDFTETPFFDYCMKTYPHSSVEAAGNAVGLPKGAQGTSEVGHLHIGAGRVVWQMYERINRAIDDGSFAQNQVLKNAIKHAKENKATLHLTGLCSDEGVHAHIAHLFAFLDMAKDAGLEDIQIHFIADGRDVYEESAEEYATKIDQKIKELGVGKITSVAGRYYSMDRDTNWDRTEKSYKMLVRGEGEKSESIFTAIKESYANGKNDYYIVPTMLNGFTPVKDKDSFVFFNFRTDRPRQLTRAFTVKGFGEFNVSDAPDVLYTAFAQYDKEFTCPYAFEATVVKNSLAEVLAKAGAKQLRIAETDKYAHVTYFFSAQIEKPYPGEERIMIPSPKVASYDKTPERATPEIAEKVAEEIKKKKYDFFVVNFSNCDLVGHSAKKDAIMKGVETVDACTKKVVDAALANDYVCYITADHGSSEEKLFSDGRPKPSHSCNPVNAIIISNDATLNAREMRDGGHENTAPTILDIMGIEQPEEMTGSSLLNSPVDE